MKSLVEVLGGFCIVNTSEHRPTILLSTTVAGVYELESMFCMTRAAIQHPSIVFECPKGKEGDGFESTLRRSSAHE